MIPKLEVIQEKWPSTLLHVSRVHGMPIHDASIVKSKPKHSKRVVEFPAYTFWTPFFSASLVYFLAGGRITPPFEMN